MERLTEEQALILTGYTMVLMVHMSVFHEDVEKRLGRPVWSHEFPGLKEEIKAAYRDDFMALIPAFHP